MSNKNTTVNEELKVLETPEEEVEEKKNLLQRAKDFVSKHKRKLMIGGAAAGAFALFMATRRADDVLDEDGDEEDYDDEPDQDDEDYEDSVTE